MKYIKRFKLLTEQNDEIEIGENDSDSIEQLKERLNELKKAISEYKMKRSKLETVVMDNAEDKDISNVIENIVNGNKFLTMYLPIIKKMARIKSLTDRIDYYKELLSERENDLMLTGKLSNPDEKVEQTDKLKGQIGDIKEKSNGMEEDIKDIEKQIQEEEKDLQDYIKNMESKFNDDIRSLKIDVRTK